MDRKIIKPIEITSEMQRLDCIGVLERDESYYGDYGKQFLSNSDVKTLLTDITQYQVRTKKTKELLIGDYIHKAILEPEKLSNIVSKENSRNATAYKKEVAEAGVEIMLLQKEVDEMKPIIDKVLSNDMFNYLLLQNLEQGEIERPEVKSMFGTWFKAKADRVNTKAGVVVDLKTTGDLSKFKDSFYRYGYDTQAYIYNALFNLEVIFLVVDKKTGALAHVSVSDHTLQNAEEKVRRAVERRQTYYLSKEGDINQYVEILEF